MIRQPFAPHERYRFREKMRELRPHPKANDRIGMKTVEMVLLGALAAAALCSVGAALGQ